MTNSSRRLARTWPYKRQVEFEREMRAVAAAWFASHGHVVNKRRPFILDEWGNWPRNIILSDVASYITDTRVQRERDKIGFPLHRYVHHGLSSQAMLFNLVGPLIVKNDYSPLATAFQAAGIPWPQGKVTVELEIEDREVFNEDSGQPTSIDLVVKGDEGGAALYVEAKLVEKEFGGCSVFAGGDCDGQNAALEHKMCYLHHIGRKYWERLEEHGFLQGAHRESPVCLLATYYQFFREMLFAIHNNGYFVLLTDERNPTFYREGKDGVRGLWPFLTQFVPQEHQHRIKRVTIQQVVTAIEGSSQHSHWVAEFKRKYGMGEIGAQSQ